MAGGQQIAVQHGAAAKTIRNAASLSTSVCYCPRRSYIGFCHRRKDGPSSGDYTRRTQAPRTVPVGRNGKKTLPRSELAAFVFHRIEDDFRRHNRAPEQKPEGISVTTFLRASSTGRTATTRKPSCVTSVSSGPLWLSTRRRRSTLRDRPRPRRQVALPDYSAFHWGRDRRAECTVSRHALGASALLLSVCPDVRSSRLIKCRGETSGQKEGFST